MKRWGSVVAVLSALIVLAVSCSVARADGDPASDVLLSKTVFLPADAGFSSAQAGRLTSLLDSAAHAGAPVRVAIIPDDYDLGSITALWKKPQTYARFLGTELSLTYKHLLVVVMPNGVGVNWPGHSTADAERQLAGLTVKSGKAGLLDAAVAAVQRLMSANHVHLPPAAQTSATGASGGQSASAANAGSAGGGGLWPIILAALAVALAGAVIAVRVLRPRLRGRAPRIATPAGRADRAQRTRWRRLAPAGLAAVVVAVGAPILAVQLLRGSSASATSGSGKAGTMYMLPTGTQRAAKFTLHDQNGKPVSLSSFGGRYVLLTFVDPLCRNLCPLEAHALNTLVDRMPASQRPAIIAVSVDRWANTRHDLLQDFRKWELVPQWHWAVGTPAQLAEVWKQYGVEVEVTTKHLAGTTVHYITHSEVTYLIDPSGYERAMFPWPFTSKDVLATLHQVSHT